MSDEESKPVLDYFGEKESRRRPPNPTQVMLLCTPGLVCWMLFFAGAAMRLDGWFLFTWFCAIGTALLSLFLYIRRPLSRMPWYVWINLLINIPGLLFSLLPLSFMIH